MEENINYPVQISQISVISMIGTISIQRIRADEERMIYFQAHTSILHGYIIHMQIVTDLVWSLMDFVEKGSPTAFSLISCLLLAHWFDQSTFKASAYITHLRNK